jgi:hypothetical protein
MPSATSLPLLLAWLYCVDPEDEDWTTGRWLECDRGLEDRLRDLERDCGRWREAEVWGREAGDEATPPEDRLLGSAAMYGTGIGFSAPLSEYLEREGALSTVEDETECCQHETGATHFGATCVHSTA